MAYRNMKRNICMLLYQTITQTNNNHNPITSFHQSFFHIITKYPTHWYQPHLSLWVPSVSYTLVFVVSNQHFYALYCCSVPHLFSPLQHARTVLLMSLLETLETLQDSIIIQLGVRLSSHLNSPPKLPHSSLVMSYTDLTIIDSHWTILELMAVWL